MIILGIDPGTARCGFGIIDKRGNSLKTVTYGLIESDREYSQPERLEIIYVEINRLMKKYRPDIMAVERLFFSRNVTTGMTVSEARGVILLCGALAGVTVMEYLPAQVKSAVTGNGTADKQQVQKMVKALLNLKEIPKPDDVADALAVAVCCGASIRMQQIKGQQS
ncbi:MAG: crossover junction endodeoxyribonuclease RuvC [Spirochaetia bacterium]|nr:crossover junction endodeoxyribonuclease RuvC [Spirochaetia bacterium]